MSVTQGTAKDFSLAATGISTTTDSLGMREMQARAYRYREKQYLLLKAPPASGKSRALMYIALDKVYHQHLKKVIIAVPQCSIGSSFCSTRLDPFFADWKIEPRYLLCDDLADSSKTEILQEFMGNEQAHFLVCSHQTLLRFYKNKCHSPEIFSCCLIALDEFHHVSSDLDESCLGSFVHEVIHGSTAHIVAMTGSYFRGDTQPVLSPEDEAKFTPVVYTYYEQLNGYRYLKRLSFDFAFYSSVWTEALPKVLDCSKKSIVYIPYVNSHEAANITKAEAAEFLLETISKGQRVTQEVETGFYTVTVDGRKLVIADLIREQNQKLSQQALFTKEHRNRVDIILALNLAKEGFDWPQCEQVVVIGARGSLNEIVQIIGRATRDSPGKEQAQYLQLIRQPSAEQDEVEYSINSLLKAIALSLLMEEVLQPQLHFHFASDGIAKDDATGTAPDDLTIVINDETQPYSPRTKSALRRAEDLATDFLNSHHAFELNMILNGQSSAAQTIFEIADFLRQEKFPSYDESEIMLIAQAILLILQKKLLFKKGSKVRDLLEKGEAKESALDLEVEYKSPLLRLTEHLINVDDIDMNLIEQTLPFADSYSFFSELMDASVFHELQKKALAARKNVTIDEALRAFAGVTRFSQDHNHKAPLPNSEDVTECYYAKALHVLQEAVAYNGGSEFTL